MLYLNNTTFSNAIQLVCKHKVSLTLQVLVGATGTVDSFKGVFGEDRFSKKPHNDIMFVVCQFLLWSRTCKKAQSELNQLFSSLHPTLLQYRPGSYDDAYRWTMNLFHNICDSINASYPPWKNGFFIPNNKHPIQCNPGQVIYLCLLGSAIEECTIFFTKMGMKTVWPDELIDLRDTLSARQQEGDKTFPDLLTMTTLSHIIRMNHKMIKSDEMENPSPQQIQQQKRVLRGRDYQGVMCSYAPKIASMIRLLNFSP